MLERFGKFDLALLPDPIIEGQTVAPNKTEDVAQMLLSTLHFARDKEDNLYVYDDGVYSLVDKDVRQACTAIYSKYRIKWTSTKLNEVERYLTDSKKTPLLLEKPSDDIIILKNGTYFINRKEFEPHIDRYKHWEHLSTLQIPIMYDPDATCPNIMQFLSEVFPNGQDLLVDVIGVCMTSCTANHKAIVLLGEGNNGKSVYLHLLRTAVGWKNVSSTTIHKLSDPAERFANNDIVGKLVNAADDIAQGKILDTANIKSIISGNSIRVEGKFRTPITYVPFCKLVFGANHRLESGDESMGYLRRIMHIPFAQTFALNPAKEKELHELFKDPQEMSGLFNEITKRLTETIDIGFRIPEAVVDLVENYDPIPDVVRQWLTTNVFPDPEGKVPTWEFYAIFNYRLYGYLARQEEIYAYLKKLFPGVKITRPRIGVDKKQVKCYTGIRVSEEVERDFRKVAPEGDVLSEIEYLDAESLDI